MAKGKTIKRTVEVIGEGEDEEEKDLEADTEDTMMEEAARDFAEGDRAIKLYRYPPGEQGGRPRFLGEVIREDFNEPFVAGRFGGGRYFGRWRKRDGSYIRYPFEIEGDPLPIKRATAPEPEPEYMPEVALTASAGPEVMMREMMKMMAEVRKDAREEMRTILEIMRPAQQPAGATEQVFSLVEKIVPLIQGGGGQESNPWIYAISQLKDPLMKIVDTVQSAVQRPPIPQAMPRGVPRAQAVAAPATVNGATEPAKGESSMGENMLVKALAQYMPMLSGAAKAGKDPALYADLILDQVPPFMYARLQAWLIQDGCLDELGKVSPSVYETAEWWEQLRLRILESLTEGEPDAVRTVQPSTDTDAPAIGAGARVNAVEPGQGARD